MNTLTDQSRPKMERNGDTAIVTFVGGKIRNTEDMIAAELEAHATALEASHLLLDFANVVCVSSAELGTLVSLNERMKTAGGRLTLFNLKPEIFDVFQVTRLQTLLGICREDRAVH